MTHAWGWAMKSAARQAAEQQLARIGAVAALFIIAAIVFYMR